MNLSGVNIPATGFSWGFDRVIEAMDQFNLFPSKNDVTQVLVAVFSAELVKEPAAVVSNLRENGLSAELFPDENAKLDKQLKYADKKGISWFIVIGPDEVKNNAVVLKNLVTGHQEDVKLDDLVEKIKSETNR